MLSSPPLLCYTDVYDSWFSETQVIYLFIAVMVLAWEHFLLVSHILTEIDVSPLSQFSSLEQELHADFTYFKNQRIHSEEYIYINLCEHARRYRVAPWVSEHHRVTHWHAPLRPWPSSEISCLNKFPSWTTWTTLIALLQLWFTLLALFFSSCSIFKLFPHLHHFPLVNHTY